jgi:hypothetical protein
LYQKKKNTREKKKIEMQKRTPGKPPMTILRRFNLGGSGFIPLSLVPLVPRRAAWYARGRYHRQGDVPALRHLPYGGSMP